jgi:deoxycytidylate deaminase
MQFRGGTTHLFPDEGWLKKKPRHRAVITKGGKMVSHGESTLGGLQGHTRQGGDRIHCRSCHAEINCIKNLPRNLVHNRRKLRNCTIWSVRWTKEGSMRMALPCIFCSNSLIRNGITTCIYSNDEGTLSRCDLREIQPFVSSGELL